MMSISRRVGCQLEIAAERRSVYLSTSTASVAGIAGTFSTTRLSPGVSTLSCASTLKHGKAATSKVVIDNFISVFIEILLGKMVAASGTP
jgi:hypothetical protein